MAPPLCVITMTLIMLPTFDATPIKHSADINKRGATDEGCQGTHCYFDPDYYENDIDVTFPENLTETVMSVLPSIGKSQAKMVSLLNQTLQQSKEHISNSAKMMSVVPSFEESQATMVSLLNQTLQQNKDLISDSVSSALQRHEKQIANLTSTMSFFLGNIINLLQDKATVQMTAFSIKDCQSIPAVRAFSSGSYVITPLDGLGSFTAYCDMDTDGGPWTVFQKRYDGWVNFTRSWYDYERGFGNTDGEHWMGLRNIRRLVSQEGASWLLRIDLEAFDGDTAYAVYDDFSTGDAETNYTLSVGTYHGNATDALNYDDDQYPGRFGHHGMKFSTYDRDNDRRSSNCASSYKGGWWYNSCHAANLNGQYLGASSGSDTSGMVWYNWKWKHSLKRSEMKMRRLE